MPSRLRVPLGYAAGLVVLYLARPSPLSLLVGLPLAVLGEALRLWASGHIEKSHRLATGGPYAHTRNPLYLGSLLMGLGLALASASLWTVLLIAAYLATFYPRVIRSEDAFLREKFPQDYAGWASEVPLLFPRLTPAGPRASRFEWRRVGANREWRTALALPAAVALLYARRLLPW